MLIMKKFLLITLMIILVSCTTNNERSFQFKYEVNLEPSNGKKIEIWIPVPQSNEVQDISNFNIYSDIQYQIKNEAVHNNKYLYMFNEKGIQEPSTITITFDVKRKEHSNQSYKGLDEDNYLGSYQTVPTGDIFSDVIKENKLSKDNVRGIYDFVFSGMHYGKPKSFSSEYYKQPWLNEKTKYGEKGVTRDRVVELYQKSKKENNNYTFGNGNAIYACDIGVGNCTDYHSYFMSLGRTLKIPVRFHMGFQLPENSHGEIGGYHCWADYYKNGLWFPVDISEADKNPAKKDYFFGTICSNRVDMITGRDFVLDNYDNGKVNLFIYPLLEIDDKPSTNYTKRFSFIEY